MANKNLLSFNQGRSWQLVYDRYPELSNYGEDNRKAKTNELTKDDESLARALQKILNGHYIQKHGDYKWRKPHNFTNGANDLIGDLGKEYKCSDLDKLDEKSAYHCGQVFQSLLDGDNKNHLATDLSKKTYKELVDMRESLLDSVAEMKERREYRAEMRYQDRMYECNCGRHVECLTCGKSFCGKNYGYTEYDNDYDNLVGYCSKACKNNYQSDDDY